MQSVYCFITLKLYILGDGISEDFGNDNIPSRTPSPMGALLFDDLNNID